MLKDMDIKGSPHISSMAPSVTLIISTFNQRQFVPLFLSAVEEQIIDAPFEIIVCDDGSGDVALSDIAYWCDTHDEIDIRFVWQPNRGFRLGRSRNNAIRCARGDVLIFVDGDEWFAPTFLQEHRKAHLVPGRLVYGPIMNITLNAANTLEQWRAQVKSEMTFNPSNTSSLPLDAARPWMACTGGNFSVHRVDCQQFDERFQGWGSEDRDLSYRLYLSGLTIFGLQTTELAHLTMSDTALSWNPLKGGDSAAISLALASKLMLWSKYPGDVMTPSLSMIRRYYLDSATDEWYLGPLREDVSIASVFHEYRLWVKRQRSSFEEDPGILA